MTPEHWEEVKDLFCLALNEPAENRLAFLASSRNHEVVRAEVRRLLQEHDRAEEFMAEPVFVKVPAPDLELVSDAACFRGIPRFVVQQRLGEGTFGVVYRALDRDRNSMVALKTLRRLDAAHLLRFKHEFRSLVDVVHPNLVQLYELFGGEHIWFFTMELVEGTDFLSYTRPNDVVLSWDRLRDALVQLTSGVEALHSSGRLHRDLKPSNVLVSNTGRVLILDFGLVKEIESESAEQSVTLAGSPAYMAPEQAGKGTITAAVDWYSVGVVLYRAITGALPFTGSWNEVLNRKRAEDPPIPGNLNPDVPEDLNEICHRLLHRSPEGRADGVFILDRLRRRTAPPARESQELFVGRSRELQSLSERFGALDAGCRQVVLLQGQSGIGKTTLITRFLGDVLRDHPDAVILRGRCRESESVPYKALDSVADELVRYLRALPAASATALLPRHPELLARLFPAFGELEVLSAFSYRTVGQSDEQEIRRRAFAAICETLGRITDLHAVVIWIDDLQWGDLDSIAFLAELVLPAHAPTLMLILSFRSEDAESSPPVHLLRTFRSRVTEPVGWTEMELAGLPEGEGVDLLRRLDSDRKLAERQLREMIEESHGSPLFLRELLRHTLEDAGLGDQGDWAGRIGVADMIRRRADKLSPIARGLFEALSAGVEPLSRVTLFRTVKASETELSRELQTLILENLVRVTGGVEAGKLEPFHDQAREALLTAMSPADLRNCHRRLALAFEAEGNPDPQRLVRHYLGAGDMRAVFQSSLAAANIAEDALAFDRAAGFYTTAIKTGEAEVDGLAMLHRKRAEALARAGRGREAAEDYLSAAHWPEYNDSFQMRRLAAEQLMRSGYLDKGFQAYTGLLHGEGVWMPTTPLKSILAMLALRAFIRLRGMHWRRRREADLPVPTLRRLDLMWSGALFLSVVNPVFGTYLQARHMLEALRAGEPCRLALSVGLGASFEALGGAPAYQDGRKFLDFAEHVASDLQDPFCSASMLLFWVTLDYVCGRITDGLEHSRKALQMQRELGTQVTWESSSLRIGLIWFLGWGGRIREMAELVPGILDEARTRGDVYTFVMIRSGSLAHLADLAADNPDRALRETSSALAQWSQAKYDFPHFAAAFAATECELYAGRVEQARSRVLREWPALKRSLLFRKCQILRIMLFYMRGRTALATWIRRSDDRILHREIEHFASLLINARSPFGAGLGDALRSGIAAARGHKREATLLLERAEATLSEQGFRLLAAAVLRRRGELEGDAGSAHVQAADAFMKSENILRPDRMTSMILPG